MFGTLLLGIAATLLHPHPVGASENLDTPIEAPSREFEIQESLPKREKAAGKWVEWTPDSTLPAEQNQPVPENDWLTQYSVGGYDEGRGMFLLLRSPEEARIPFELRFDIITQLRYTGFSRSADEWVDSSGQVRPIRNISVFEINRNWFEFSGHALDPRLQFRTAVFTSTASNNSIFLGYLRYEFAREFRFNGGYWKVPGTREFQESFRHTLGTDRTMATTFFRPGFSPGIWIDGEVDSEWHYVAMISNSFNGQDETANRVGTEMAYAGSFRWEPWGEFGVGPSDIENHVEPALRLGSSATYTRKVNQGAQSSPLNPEDTILRLTDGTPVFQFGSLGTQTQLTAANVTLWTLDTSIKWRGFSLSSELFLRWLTHFDSQGQAPTVSRLFDRGGYVQGSYFVIPQMFEPYVRTSLVAGEFGRGYEWSGGFNYYPQGKRSWRCTFDITRILHSPADNILTGYRAGESGTLFQAQLFVDF